MINNVRLVTEIGELALGKVETINIILNRIVDDFTEIDNRFQDFTYEFSIPRIKQNELVFNNAGALYKKNVFAPNLNINCSLYNNDILLLEGVINLVEISNNDYKVNLNSKFKEFIDDIGKKKMNEVTFPIITWDYEQTIVDHINANYKNSDETTHQFPLCFYSTPFSPYNVDNSLNNNVPEYNYLIWKNNLGLDELNNNRVYQHQLPPAIYLVSIIKQIFNNTSWSIGGNFFEDDNLKKIIYLYAGDDDIYDKATLTQSGSTTTTLQLGKFLPATSQSDFIQSVINTFNLYLTIDTKNKVINFETYNTLFSDKFNPYDISSLVFNDDVKYKYIENNNPSIVFDKAQNRNVFGDNYALNDSLSLYLYNRISISNNNYNKTFNHEGTTDNIKLIFSEPTTKNQYLLNEYNINGVHIDFIEYMPFLPIPILSKQTPVNNEGKKFYNETGDTYVMNNESTITYAGSGSLMYYYGPSDTKDKNFISDTFMKDYYYINIYANSVLNKVRIGIASPWQLNNAKFNNINSVLGGVYMTGVTLNTADTREVITASYINKLSYLFRTANVINQDKETKYSLVFDDDNANLHDTLWSTFHKNKYDTYKNGMLLEGTMRMSPKDWQEMQMQRPISYNGNIYRLISLTYNPIRGIADIQMVSK